MAGSKGSRKRRVLIIGAAGAVGKALARAILARRGPDSVIAVLRRTPLPCDLRQASILGPWIHVPAHARLPAPSPHTCCMGWVIHHTAEQVWSASWGRSPAVFRDSDGVWTGARAD